MYGTQLAIRNTTTAGSYLWLQNSFLYQNYSLADAVCSQIHQYLQLRNRIKLEFKAIFDSVAIICYYVIVVNKEALTVKSKVYPLCSLCNLMLLFHRGTMKISQ